MTQSTAVFKIADIFSSLYEYSVCEDICHNWSHVGDLVNLSSALFLTILL